jgi:hypothetical protein
MGYKVVRTFCVIFQFLTMFNTIVGAGTVGAGAASRYGSGQKMRLLAAPALQHWFLLLYQCCGSEPLGLDPDLWDRIWILALTNDLISIFFCANKYCSHKYCRNPCHYEPA